MDRKLNVVFSFVAVLMVVLNMGDPAYYWRIIGGLPLAFLFSLIAFFLQRLSLDGLFAATVVGTLIFGLGGWPMAVVILLFFVSSTIFSDTQNVDSSESSEIIRRNGMQVWANGFWLVLCLVLAVAFESSVFLIGGISAIAVATADTWATELRSTKTDTTYLITTFEPVSQGTDGGISLKGTAWAIAGSLLIAATSIYVFSLQFGDFFFIFIAGFSGCLIDSYFGATFQQNHRPVTIPFIQKQISVNNNLVNAISTGAGAVLAIILRIVII